ncbi:hypothetical protein [Gluconobacter wancherniae]|uniref:hypothetical protein n=1 Tax=Gluconobacter wancherniae TaxID=1307955 RepID=UPI00201144F4|nr:hypothetical protein [Gluconobacter wancherniae]
MVVTTDAKNWRGLFSDVFGLLFALAWATRGAQAARLPLVPVLLVIALVSLPLLVGFVHRDIILRHPEVPGDRELMRKVKIMRIVLITAASWWAHATHHMPLFLPLLGIVIGLSYLPLGKALNEPVHYVVGSVIVSVSVLSFLLQEPLHMEVAGFGTAIAIWLGCVARLWRSGIVFRSPLGAALPQ